MILSEGAARQLLVPFGVALNSKQLDQLMTYLDLLLRWNRKINLTAVRTAEECVTRHFGESLFLARWVELKGSLLDIGSGAGFPGLALKIAFPDILTTLLEPVAKKRAFLKEVARSCGMESVEVRGERLEDLLGRDPTPAFETATARAVGGLKRLVPKAVQCLKPGGRLCLWLTRGQVTTLVTGERGVEWGQPFAVPLGRQREIWIGTRIDVSATGDGSGP